jgi:hypothetical protein
MILFLGWGIVTVEQFDAIPKALKMTNLPLAPRVFGGTTQRGPRGTLLSYKQFISSCGAAYDLRSRGEKFHNVRDHFLQALVAKERRRILWPAGPLGAVVELNDIHLHPPPF